MGIMESRLNRPPKHREGHSLKLLFIVHVLIMHAIVMSTTPDHHAVAMAIKGLPWQVYIA